MGRRKEEVRKPNFDATCTVCRRRYESEFLGDIPAECCGFLLVINDNRRLYSLYKDELKEIYDSYRDR